MANLGTRRWGMMMLQRAVRPGHLKRVSAPRTGGRGGWRPVELMVAATVLPSSPRAVQLPAKGIFLFPQRTNFGNGLALLSQQFSLTVNFVIVVRGREHGPATHQGRGDFDGVVGPAP